MLMSWKIRIILAAPPHSDAGGEVLVTQTPQAAEKAVYFVIPGEARNLSSD
jgi:hypothetical protein